MQKVLEKIHSLRGNWQAQFYMACLPFLNGLVIHVWQLSFFLSISMHSVKKVLSYLVMLCRCLHSINSFHDPQPDLSFSLSKTLPVFCYLTRLSTTFFTWSITSTSPDDQTGSSTAFCKLVNVYYYYFSSSRLSRIFF